MKVRSLASPSLSKTGFKVLDTTAESQLAVMILRPGLDSSKKPDVHASSDQVLLLCKGKLSAEISGQKHSLDPGDSVLVPAGTPHKFTCQGKRRAVTLNVYSPPAYPENEE